MLSACMFCAVSIRYLANEKEQPREDKSMAVLGSGQVQEAFLSQNMEESLQNAETEYRDWYAYYCLNEEERQIYREIYNILCAFGEEVEISAKDTTQLADIFQCVLNDHPEIFYVQGYTYTSFTRGDRIARITLSGDYSCTQEEARKRQAQIDAYTSKCLAGIAEDASDYEKVKYIYEYLIENTQYNQAVEDNQNICSVFLHGESVCQGYAKATQYLLNKAGVFCTLVIGSVSDGEGHAWNLVNMDGNYYYVDTTWGDASYQVKEEIEDAWNKGTPVINYDYLGVTTEQLLRTHRIDNVVPMPYCVSTECNYYVKEGTYLEECDEEILQALFDAKMTDGKRMITLKCSNEEVYNRARSLLILEQRIFEYMHQSDGVVAYSDNEVQQSMSFWVTVQP